MNKLKFYLAGPWEKRVLMSGLIQTIEEEMDWKCTYDWTTVQGTTHRKTVSKEKEAIKNADLVIVLGVLPSQMGTWWEAGYAEGLGKQILIFKYWNKNLVPLYFSPRPNIKLVEVHTEDRDWPETVNWKVRAVPAILATIKTIFLTGMTGAAQGPA